MSQIGGDSRQPAAPSVAVEAAGALARSELARLQALGLALSQNDCRVTVISQFLALLGPAASPDAVVQAVVSSLLLQVAPLSQQGKSLVLDRYGFRHCRTRRLWRLREGNTRRRTYPPRKREGQGVPLPELGTRTPDGKQVGAQTGRAVRCRSLDYRGTTDIVGICGVVRAPDRRRPVPGVQIASQPPVPPAIRSAYQSAPNPVALR